MIKHPCKVVITIVKFNIFSFKKGLGGLQQNLNPLQILMKLMKLVLMLIHVALVRTSSQLHTPILQLVYIHIVMHMSHFGNVPVVSRATAYDHPNGNTYILIFHESLYYGKQMKQSLINPNQIRLSGLDFFDNPINGDELYIEMDDEVNAPVKFTGNKCIILSRMPTRAELDTC